MNFLQNVLQLNAVYKYYIMNSRPKIGNIASISIIVYLYEVKRRSNFNIVCYIRTYHLEFEVQHRGKTTFKPFEAK